MTPKIMLQECLKILGWVLILLGILKIYTTYTIMSAGSGSITAMVNSGSWSAYLPSILWLAGLFVGARLCFWFSSK